jgi:signal transduction histidine kinase
VTDPSDPLGELRRLQRLRTVGRLAAGIVHDLNNVFGVILHFVEQAAARAPDRSEQQLLTATEASLERGLEIIRTVANYAVGGMPSRERSSAEDIADDVARLLGADCRARGVELDRDGGPADVRGPRAEICDAVLQLARHAAATCGADRRVVVRTARARRDGRPSVMFEVEVRGAEAVDEALQQLAAQPEDGFERGLRGFGGDAVAFARSLVAVALAGGWFECRAADGVRRLCIGVPAANAAEAE